jgi:hypothetical protein
VILKRYLLGAAALLSVLCTSAQVSVDTVRRPFIITADSLASGNYKDVFTSFFQLAFNDIAGPGKGIAFASNPYAMMAKSNPALLVDTNYVKYRHLRDLNFNVGVSVDSLWHLNGFSAGLKYAIVNKRDVSISHKFIGENIRNTSQLKNFNRQVAIWLSRNIAKDAAFAELLNAKVNLWENNDTFSFSMMPADVRDTVMAIINNPDNGLDTMAKLMKDDPNLIFKKTSDGIYQELEGRWQNKPLWIVAANSSFSAEGSGNLKAISPNNVMVYSEFLAGLNDPKCKIKWDLDVLASYSMVTDSSLPRENIEVHKFEFRPGFNFVLKSSGTTSSNASKPYLEFKISGSYFHTFSALAPGQKADDNTINGDLRLRIYQDIWVPVSITWDPANGNVFGYLSVKANFTALNNAMKKLGLGS